MSADIPTPSMVSLKTKSFNKTPTVIHAPYKACHHLALTNLCSFLVFWLKYQTIAFWSIWRNLKTQESKVLSRILNLQTSKLGYHSVVLVGGDWLTFVIELSAIWQSSRKCKQSHKSTCCRLKAHENEWLNILFASFITQYTSRFSVWG